MVMSLSSGGSDLGGTHTEGGHARPRDHSTSGLRLSCHPRETIPDTRCLEASSWIINLQARSRLPANRLTKVSHNSMAAGAAHTVG
jgi:hypothetical protein